MQGNPTPKKRVKKKQTTVLEDLEFLERIDTLHTDRDRKDK